MSKHHSKFKLSPKTHKAFQHKGKVIKLVHKADWLKTRYHFNTEDTQAKGCPFCGEGIPKKEAKHTPGSAIPIITPEGEDLKS